jgi:hypothetical protein
MVARPFVQVLAVEQHIGIAGRRRGAMGAGVHRRRLRPADVVGAPLRIGHLRTGQGELCQLGIGQPGRPARMLRHDALQFGRVHGVLRLRCKSANAGGRQCQNDGSFHDAFPHNRRAS